jgi:ribosomal protein S18 acetylase RimI-like enzyme
MPDHPSLELTFRAAVPTEAGKIAELVNAAYRGEAGEVGWTHERDLFDGPRTAEAEIGRLIHAGDSRFLLCLRGAEIAGSVHLRKMEGDAYLGLLAVNPALQGAGLGRRLIERAEQFVRETWGSRKMLMTVLALRGDLIAYYERRGYRRTGKIEPLTMEGQAGRPKAGELMLVWLEKPLG